MSSSYFFETELHNVQHDYPRHYKPIDDLYLGANVAVSLSTAPNLNPNDVHVFKLRCLGFYVEGAK